MATADDVLAFWFDELTPEQWFKTFAKVDGAIRTRFGETHDRAVRAELWSWRETAEGRLAEIIVLDQFSRNLYREDGRGFAADPLSLALAQEAIRAGADQVLEGPQLAFLFMPFMHSESLAIHDIAGELFLRPGLERNLESQIQHRVVLERFGRYPHRNAVLGRESTAEELAFLEGGRGF